MAVDPNQHEENKLKFLEALYAIIEEYLASHPEASDPTLIGEREGVIGHRAGLMRQQAGRNNSELEHEGLTRFMGAITDGPNTCFTSSTVTDLPRLMHNEPGPA